MVNSRTVLLKVGPERWGSLPGKSGNWVFVSGEACSGFSGTYPAAAQWDVNHNLGRRPAAVTLRTTGGVQFDALVVHINNNQLIVYFDNPCAGSVEIS